MLSRIVKRSVFVGTHKTSITLEEDFWVSFREIARLEGRATRDIMLELRDGRVRTNLSSSVRLYVLNYYKGRAS